MSEHLEKLRKNIESLRLEIINHPLYAALHNLVDIRRFMEFHVFAVWDFMSLLKVLQVNLTGVQIPWMPTGDAETRYLINEIVTGEESDVDRFGKRTSHYELYLKAMKQAGANTGEIERFTAAAQKAADIRQFIGESTLPDEIKNFLDVTFEVVESNKPHVQAAVFTFGREDLIPAMFLSMVADIEREFPDKIADFKYYLHRHIEVDGGEHSHLALAMTEKLCGGDADKWREAEIYVLRSLAARVELWNGVLRRVQSNLTAAANRQS